VSPIVITFDSNGGGAATNTQNVTNLSSTNLTSNSFTRSGYTFSGWNTVAGGTGTAYADGASITPNAAITLYAQWTAAPSNNSNNSQSSSSAAEPTSTPTKPAKPIEPAKPVVVEVPTTPVLRAGDGTPVINYTSNETLTLVNGTPVSETIKVEELVRLITDSQGVQLELQTINSSAKPILVDGQMKLALEHEGNAKIAGTGFKKETLVKVWLFSDPIFLGEFKVGEDGKFNASIDVLNSLPVGNHVLQINGLSVDNKVFSQSIPVIVKAKDNVEIKPVEPTPVVPNPVEPEPTVKSKTSWAFVLYFKNKSNRVDTSIKSFISKYAPRVKAAKSVTCIAYYIPKKDGTYKLERLRARNACVSLKKSYNLKVFYKIAPISAATTKVKVPAQSRSGRVDIFVTK
jgi:uncharacterized repeat protein (TIGR02543 family)